MPVKPRSCSRKRQARGFLFDIGSATWHEIAMKLIVDTPTTMNEYATCACFWLMYVAIAVWALSEYARLDF
jgi:hypothetical protein